MRRRSALAGCALLAALLAPAWALAQDRAQQAPAAPALPAAAAASATPALPAAAASAPPDQPAAPAAGASGAAVSTLLAEIGRRLEHPQVLRGRFEQSKTVPGLSRPLVSHGSFVVLRGRGVQWVTSAPFASTVVLTRDRLLRLRPAPGGAGPGSGAGAGGAQAPAHQPPGLRALNEMLLALLAGDLQALAADFAAQPQLLGAQGWRLTLRPLDAALASALERIELEGAQHIQALDLYAASGEVSRMRFSALAASTLSPAEAGNFAQ